MNKKPAIAGQPLVEHIYTADPSAHVFEGRIYIYPSHDLDRNNTSNDTGDQYDMEDYHILSIGDFAEGCEDHGEALHLRDIPWASQQLWAPDAACRNGRYYLFFPARDREGIFRIGVATSASPAGPFKAEPDYLQGSYSIDPAVLVDDDERAWVYFGGLWGGQLESWQTGRYLADAKGPASDAPAIGPRVAELAEDMLSLKGEPKEIVILDGQGQPLQAGDEDRRYFEGPWMHKYQGRYYLSYSTGTTHRIVYAVGDKPEGPFVYQGCILEPVVGWTTHHSIVEYQGEWYLFYHDSSLSGGADNKRCVKFAKLHYNPDGTIQTVKR